MNKRGDNWKKITKWIWVRRLPINPPALGLGDEAKLQ